MSRHFHGRISKLTMYFHEQYLPPQGKESRCQELLLHFPLCRLARLHQTSLGAWHRGLRNETPCHSVRTAEPQPGTGTRRNCESGRPGRAWRITGRVGVSPAQMEDAKPSLVAGGTPAPPGRSCPKDARSEGRLNPPYSRAGRPRPQYGGCDWRVGHGPHGRFVWRHE